MPELNRGQFSQPRLPGMTAMPMGQAHVGHGESVPEGARTGHITDYHETFGPDSPAHGQVGVGHLARNPLFSREDSAMVLKADRAHVNQRTQQGEESYPYEPSQREEYVPTWKVSSFQKQINASAVDHIAANANMMDLNESPMMSKFNDLDTGEERYMVEDGNHRTNAAQKQGRLFIPANVSAWRPKSRT